MAKQSGMTQIKTSMPKTFPKTTKAKVQREHPAKQYQGSKSNEVDRPPKK